MKHREITGSLIERNGRYTAIMFFENHCVNVGFSLDGYQELHDKNRCNSFQRVMDNIQKYREITGHYPTFNATVGQESLLNRREVISFFRSFGTRVTFSRMIGRYGIGLKEYNDFLEKAEQYLPVRRGGLANLIWCCLIHRTLPARFLRSSTAQKLFQVSIDI